MTYNEIIKALGCCNLTADCYKCPYEGKCWQLNGDAAALIIRQKAEIERLKSTLDDVLDRQPLLVERAEQYAKTEAIKEFCEKRGVEYVETDI